MKPDDNDTIWCLFSIDNNYDQPENNLVCWWPLKPSLDELCKGIHCLPLNELCDDNIILLVNLWKGKPVTRSVVGTRYRLQQVKEGECI